MASGTQRQSYPRTLPKLTGTPWLARLTLIAVSIIVLVNLIGMLVVAGYQVYYDRHIFPGVSVWGTDLSGMTPEQAAAALNGKFTYPQRSRITLRDGDKAWPITAGELGVRFDMERTVQAAYNVGRQGDIIASIGQEITAWRVGISVSPVIVFDQIAADRYLSQIAAQVDRPPLDATVRVENLQAVTTLSQIGRTLDKAATLDALGKLVTRLDSGDVPLAIVETPPQVTTADDAAKTINSILSKDIDVFIQGGTSTDPGPWIASRESLARMLKIDLVPAANGVAAHYDVRLDEQQLQAFLTPLAPELTREPANARFTFDDKTRQLVVIQPSQQGRTLNIPASIQAINQLALTDTHHIPLVFDFKDPDVPDTANAEKLGITQLVSSATTYFPGSIPERKNNVQTASARFHGLVIAPHEQFSFDKYLGDVSPETGFDEALIIFNGRTIKGVGGGVCQVSTTAYQAAFYAGFPILMRVPHGYRVGYYEHGEGPGMDATVFAPVVDMQFVNDSDSYLLIETYVDLKNSSLTFKFYGTSDGRTVQKDGPFVTNTVAHGDPKYEENPDVPSGQTRQVDYAVDGADVRVERTVYRNGQILYHDTFVSHYLPWTAVYQVHPGELPPEGSPPPENATH
jgi:vancomycin resistance protein YoaR